MREQMMMREAFRAAMDLAKRAGEDVGLLGHGVIACRDGDGKVRWLEPFANQITTAGDTFYATRGVASIGTPNISQPTLVNGMKLGTGTTAVAKSSTGAALVTYLSGSNKIFDTSHPQLEDLAGDTGFNAVYQCSWAAGVATSSAIAEAAIVNDAGSNATSSAANTISRITFTAKDKGADDSLTITWKHTFNG